MCVSLSSKKSLNLTENHLTGYGLGTSEVKLLRQPPLGL
jgi:hypothetical protein